MKPSTLIVDDEPLIRSSLKKAFVNAGHDADIAATLAEAEAALARNRYDLCIVDLKLENASGLDLLRRLRTQPLTPDIPCIALSANAMPEDIASALAAGFNDYWTKPIRFKPFLDALERLFPPA